MKRILYFAWDTRRVTNTVNGAPLCTFDYGHDPLNRVVARNADTFDYNQRSEVVNAGIGTNQWAYLYDSIGNRIAATENTETTEYVANELNQYLRVLAPSRETFLAYNSVVFLPLYDSNGNISALMNGIYRQYITPPEIKDGTWMGQGFG